MNVMWMIAGVGILGAGAKLVTWLRGRGREIDPGFVSHQWLVEHRHSA